MIKYLLAAAACAAALGAQAAPSSVEALSRCDEGFFKAFAADKNIADSLKNVNGDMAFIRRNDMALQEVHFKNPVKEEGITLTGFIVNDAIERYFGVPDMHNHFWGFTVKEDWMKVVDKLKLNWEAVDTTHKNATFNTQSRKNGDKAWKAYQRPQNEEMPEFGRAVRAFHVAPYGKGSMIFCSLQSAGAPDEAILASTRPDLLWEIAAAEKAQKVKDAQKAKENKTEAKK